MTLYRGDCLGAHHGLFCWAAADWSGRLYRTLPGLHKAGREPCRCGPSTCLSCCFACTAGGASDAKRDGDISYPPVPLMLGGRRTANKAGGRGAISIELEDDGSYSEIGGDGDRVKLAPAKITLNDCLACSGCITSAESVLITQQSVDELLSVLQHPSAPAQGAPTRRVQLVVSVAPQCWASVAAHFGISGGEALGIISGLFRGLGAVAVLDLSLAKDLSVIETCAHAEMVYRAQQSAGGSEDKGRKTNTIMASSCPGWICYAEKREHKALPMISPVKSPQQIAGTLVKGMWAQQRGVAAKDIYHVCVMPCFDKKLEASRPEFRVPGDKGEGPEEGDSSREVDLVLSASELLELASKVLPGLEQLLHIPRGAIETLWGESRDPQTLAAQPEWGTAGTSGGFAQYVFQHLARSVHNRQVDVQEAGVGLGAPAAAVEGTAAVGGGVGNEDVEMGDGSDEGAARRAEVCVWKQGRNSDMHELVLEAQGQGGAQDAKRPLLRVARCYGFRNIQNITRQLKSPKGCPYDFVEVMACPSGCINGGGQIRAEDGGEAPKARLARVMQIFRDGQTIREPSLMKDGQARAIYASVIKGAPNSQAAAALLHTSYKAAEDPTRSNPIGIQW